MTRAPSPPRAGLSVSGTNLEQARSHNRRAVMQAIRLHGRLTRAEIARLTALTPQTISNITAELEALGFLEAQAPERGTRGQPATPFVIRPDGAWSIGLQVDHRLLIAVLVDLSGRVRARRAVPVDRPTPAQALPVIEAAVRGLREDAGVDWRRVLGAGLAVPGPFGVEGLSAVGPTSLPGWADREVAAPIAAALGLPVRIENDATAAAFGERLHGVARQLRSFTYVFIGTGLGAGLFQDGHLAKGAHHNAGEIGHMVVVPEGRACPCGNQGCLERYVSLRAAYEALGLPDPDRAEPSALLDPTPATRVKLGVWLEEASRRLRQAVNVLESTLDAESIVIGGFLPPPVLQLLIERLPPLHVSVAARRDRAVPRVMAGLAGEDTVALGAAALPIFDEFDPHS